LGLSGFCGGLDITDHAVQEERVRKGEGWKSSCGDHAFFLFFFLFLAQGFSFSLSCCGEEGNQDSHRGMCSGGLTLVQVCEAGGRGEAELDGSEEGW